MNQKIKIQAKLCLKLKGLTSKYKTLSTKYKHDSKCQRLNTFFVHIKKECIIKSNQIIELLFPFQLL